MNNGVGEDQIVGLALDEIDNAKYRNPFELNQVVKERIQSALSVADPDKMEQEIASLTRIPDSFRKIVVVKDYIKPWQDENGIYFIGVEDFLLDEDIIS